jgi:7-carboxy-7-deazaguanine synthase
MPVAEVVEAVLRHRTRHVVVTGGEPLLAPELPELLARLADAGRHITVETAATIFRPIYCDLVSLSPKLANSAPRDREEGRFLAMHEAARWRPDVIREFLKHHDCQVKFVVNAPTDMAEIDSMLSELPPIPADRILLMPQGVSREELANRAAWLATLCVERGWRFCPRLHIELYGHTRGT